MSARVRVGSIARLIAAFLFFMVLVQLPTVISMFDTTAMVSNLEQYLHEHPEVLLDHHPEMTFEDLQRLQTNQLINLIYETYPNAEMTDIFPVDALFGNINPFTYILFNLVVLGIYAFMWHREEQRITDLAPVTITPKMWLLICSAATAVLLIGNSLIDVLRIFGFQESREDLAFLARQGVLMFAISVTIIGPLTEEFFLRGILFNRLRGLTTLRSALLISSTLFALLHGLTINAIFAFILGYLIAILLIRSGQMRTALIAHIAANGGQLLVLAFFMTGLELLGVDSSNLSHNYLGLLLLPALYLAYYSLKELNRLLPPLPDTSLMTDPYTPIAVETTEDMLIIQDP